MARQGGWNVYSNPSVSHDAKPLPAGAAAAVLSGVLWPGTGVGVAGWGFCLGAVMTVALLGSSALAGGAALALTAGFAGRGAALP